MAKTPEQMTDTAIANLADKTGKSLEEWLKVVRATKLQKHGEIVKFLKSEHDVTHGYANLIAHKALEPVGGAPAGDELVDAQFSGSKEALRPIYDALVQAIQKFGSDVELSPKKAYVSVRRSKQFAILQPSTATRFDVGINLKGVPAAGRLEASGSFNAMVTHRVRVGDKREVDPELIGWLKKAYAAS
jgi:hypothetical protein